MGHFARFSHSLSLQGLRRPSLCLIPAPCRQPANAEGGWACRTSTGDSRPVPPVHCKEMFTCPCSVFAQGAKTRRSYHIVFTTIERPMSRGADNISHITHRSSMISGESRRHMTIFPNQGASGGNQESNFKNQTSEWLCQDFDGPSAIISRLHPDALEMFLACHCRDAAATAGQ